MCVCHFGFEDATGATVLTKESGRNRVDSHKTFNIGSRVPMPLMRRGRLETLRGGADGSQSG